MFNFVKPPPVPGFLKRAAQAARYTIRGVRPDSWMSPLEPIKPFTPEQAAWQWDRPVGYNIFYTPRGRERYSFEDLRHVARNSELVRLAIETRLDQVSAIKWQIKPLDDNENDDDPRIKDISDFLQKPDKIHDWDQWLRMVLEELFVTDGVSLARRQNRGGKLYALEPVDPATIFPLIDQDGRQPLPPDPAFQQILKGVPKANYTSDELIYYVRKAQVNTPYGFSAVEQIIESANTDIERIKYTLSYFTDGSVPDAYITAPDGMTPDKVLAYEAHLNSLLAGNQVGRRQMPVLVHGMEIKSMKQAELKNDFDEWLARKVCFAFSLPPTAFIKSNNRATAESEKQRAQDEGLYPVLLYVKRLIDRIIREDFNAGELEFHWNDDEEKDPLTQAQINVMYVKEGILARNEVRDDLGMDDVPGGEEPMVDTMNGPVPLPGSPLDQQMKQEQQEQAQQSQEHALAITQAKQSSVDAEAAQNSQGNGSGQKTGTPADKVIALPFPAHAVKKKASIRRIHVPFVTPATQKAIQNVQLHVAAALKKAGEATAKKFLTAHKADDGDDDYELAALAGIAGIDTALSEVAADSGQSFLAQLKLPGMNSMFDQVNDRAVAYAKARAADLVSGVDDATRVELRGIITTGLEENIGMDAIADQISQAYAFSDDRAGLIARTEITMANQTGALEGMKLARGAGVKLKKVWVPDDDACEDCQANGDDGAIDLDDQFSSGDDAPPAHPRCECSLASEAEEENGNETDEEE